MRDELRYPEEGPLEIFLLTTREYRNTNSEGFTWGSYQFATHTSRGNASGAIVSNVAKDESAASRPRH